MNSEGQELRRVAGEVRAECDVVAAKLARTVDDAWRARLRARAIRDWSVAVRQARKVRSAPPPVSRVHWFTINGELGDRHVSARWERGSLSCDERLLTQARLMVDLGTVFEHSTPAARVEATLDGEPAAVMLTLAKACDFVTRVEFDGAAS